jgi:HEAT repeat protein
MLRRSMMNEPGSPPADTSQQTSERVARERRVTALLRQLWLGLSTYRLYPENPQRPGFAPAVERIGTAAQEVLAGGRVDVEIRGDRFVLSGTPLSADANVQRLALSCFERRVERLTVVAVPTAAELEQLFSALTQPLPDLEEAGGVESVLREAQVSSIFLSAIGPGTVEGADHAVEAAIPTSPAPLNVDVLASELMLEDLHGSPSDQAETLLTRLRQVFAEGASRGGPLIELHTAAHDMLTDLPDDVRRSLMEMLVDRVRDDPLAGSLIGTMNSSQLTRALVDVGRGGRRSPVDLARDLAASGVREVDIVDLTRALEAGHEDVGTIIAGLEQLGIDLEGGQATAGASVLDVLSEYLTATEREDLGSMRSAAEVGGQELHAAQLLAVADYLSLETDLERAGEALDIWAEELRRALRARDAREVAALLHPLREALLGGAEDRAALYAACIKSALAPEVVLEAVATEAAEDHPHLATLLGPFGDEGVEALLDLLGDEQDRNRRGLLFGALRRIVPEHTGPVVARLSSDRWFVVRNAVLLLGSTGNPSVLGSLAEAARHPAPEVRREVPDAIASVGGAASVPHLVRMAIQGEPDLRRQAVSSLGTLTGQEADEGLAEVVRTSTDHTLRNQAIDRLAERPGGRAALDALIARGSQTRLPWRLRRYVRRALGRSSAERR